MRGGSVGGSRGGGSAGGGRGSGQIDVTKAGGRGVPARSSKGKNIGGNVGKSM